MKKTLIILTLCFSLINCGEVPTQKEGSSATLFKTTAPSQLYFNNIRSTAYELEEVGANKMKVYHYRQFDRQTNEPMIFPMIVLNWMADEAYLFIEKSQFNAFAEPLTLRIESKPTELLVLENQQQKTQHAFLLKLFNWMKNKEVIQVKTTAEGFVDIFEDFGDRADFVKVVNDYLRLTDGR